MGNKIIVLVSGGLDSFVAYHYLKNMETILYTDLPIIPVFIDYNGVYTKKEKLVCESLFPNLIIDISLNFKGQEIGDKAFIKNRNAHFALIGSKYGKTICMAGLKDDNVGDKSAEAFMSMGNLLSVINPGEEYDVFSPFWRKTKSEVIAWYLKTNLPIDDLLKTTSCYHPTKMYCGECPSCFRKYCAFCDNGISKLLPMFTNKRLALEYFKNSSTYNLSRQNSIIAACSSLEIT